MPQRFQKTGVRHSSVIPQHRRLVFPHHSHLANFRGNGRIITFIEHKADSETGPYKEVSQVQDMLDHSIDVRPMFKCGNEAPVANYNHMTKSSGRHICLR